MAREPWAASRSRNIGNRVPAYVLELASEHAHQWKDSQYPLITKGPKRRPIVVGKTGWWRFYYATKSRDAFMMVVVSGGRAAPKVWGHLTPAVHAELLVTSLHMNSFELARRIGTKRKRRRDDKIGIWTVATNLDYPGYPDEHVDSILKRVQPFAKSIATVLRQKIAGASMCLVMQGVGEFPEVWTLKAKTMARLAKLGITLNIQRASASLNY